MKAFTYNFIIFSVFIQLFPLNFHFFRKILASLLNSTYSREKQLLTYKDWCLELTKIEISSWFAYLFFYGFDSCLFRLRNEVSFIFYYFLHWKNLTSSVFMEDQKKKTSTSLLEKGPQKIVAKEPLSVIASDKKRKNKKSEVQQENQADPSTNPQDTSEPMEVDEIPILIKSDSEWVLNYFFVHEKFKFHIFLINQKNQFSLEFRKFGSIFIEFSGWPIILLKVCVSKPRNIQNKRFNYLLWRKFSKLVFSRVKFMSIRKSEEEKIIEIEIQEAYRFSAKFRTFVNVSLKTFWLGKKVRVSLIGFLIQSSN